MNSGKSINKEQHSPEKFISEVKLFNDKSEALGGVQWLMPESQIRGGGDWDDGCLRPSWWKSLKDTITTNNLGSDGTCL
jgi:hypothetical protein